LINTEYKAYLQMRGAKHCNKCETAKPFKAFGINNSNSNGLSNQCKECRNYRVVSKRYGLINNQLNNLFKEQDHKCAICKTRTELAVDHCHETGKVRGLLCTNCNNGLGRFFDNITFLENAICYLRRNYE
jgi:hypothetical protein